MSTSQLFVDNILVNHSEAIENSDGSVTYRVTFDNFPAHWHPAPSDVDVKITAEVTVPSGTPVPSPGSVFRFAGNGGYIIGIWGSDWDTPDGITYNP